MLILGVIYQGYIINRGLNVYFVIRILNIEMEQSLSGLIQKKSKMALTLRLIPTVSNECARCHAFYHNKV